MAVRRYFTDYGFGSGDTLKLALLDLLRYSEKTQRNSYLPVVSKTRAAFTAKTLQNHISKEFLTRNPNESDVSYIYFLLFYNLCKIFSKPSST